MSIKSSQKLVQEANETIETLSAEQIKSLVEKKRGHLDRCERYSGTMERGNY